jgi:Tfp pilus assembly protein PilO
MLLKKRTDIVIFIAFIGLAVLLSSVYYVGRSRLRGEIRLELEALRSQQQLRTPVVSEPERLGRMFPLQPELSAFVDGLYRYARKSGIRNIEVQTLAAKDRAPRPAGRKDVPTKLMRSYPLRIMMEGTYRNIAEYIRLLQNSERFTRVRELEIEPGKGALKATMTLEIFSIEGPDA